MYSGCLGSEPATGQRCRLCCRLLGTLPTLNSAAKIREFYTKLLYRFSITNPKSVADSLPAHFPASSCALGLHRSWEGVEEILPRFRKTPWEMRAQPSPHLTYPVATSAELLGRGFEFEGVVRREVGPTGRASARRASPLPRCL